MLRPVIWDSRLYSLVLGLWVSLAAPLPNATPSHPPPQDEAAKVVWVHDGDTIMVRMGGRKEKVRLIGINSPELGDGRRGRRDLAYEARDHARRRLRGSVVVLRRDPLCSDRDDYGRLLRYVILGDGSNFDEEMVRLGYAWVIRRFPFSSSGRFREAAQQARREKRGVWALPSGRDASDEKAVGE